MTSRSGGTITPAVYSSDENDTDIEFVPLTARLFSKQYSSALDSNPSFRLPHVSSWGLQRSHILEFVTSLLVFLTGWWIPRFWMLAGEKSLISKAPPYQLTKAGDVILDFALSGPLVDPPTIGSTVLVWTSVWLPLLFVAIVSLVKNTSQNESILSGSDGRLCHPVASVSAFLSAIGLSEGATQILKQMIQRRRPNFYALCGFDPATKSCTAPFDRVREAQYSFPSGHSSLASCSMVFLAWFCCGMILSRTSCDNRCVGMLRKGKRGSCALLLVLFLGWAVFVAATRVVDSWHHFSDILAGLAVGGIVATSMYHVYYPPLWNSNVGTPWTMVAETIESVDNDVFSLRRE